MSMTLSVIDPTAKGCTGCTRSRLPEGEPFLASKDAARLSRSSVYTAW